MLDFLQSIGAIGGVGAVFATLMFFIFLKVLRVMREDRKYMEDRMKDCLDDYRGSVQENTKVLSELYTWLKAKNGSR